MNAFQAALCLFALGSCAAPMPSWDAADPGSEPQARALLARSLAAVEGPEPITEIRVHYSGQWGFWVKRIQPEVTDASYRVTAVDVLRPQEDRITQVHSGPKGDKRVRWDGKTVEVSYPDQEPPSPAEQQAAALVAEAYQLFLLGPRYLQQHAQELRALPAIQERGRSYERLIARLSPGLGLSAEDFVVLWVDAESDLPYRVHFTLEGFESTQGAHADTTYSAWLRVQGHAFPTEYVERVRGPLRLHAHRWRVTELELP